MLDSLQAPPEYLAPKATRPEIVVDAWRTMLADPDGNLVGLNGDAWGRSNPLSRVVYAGRNLTRDT